MVSSIIKKNLKQALVTLIYDTVLQNPPGIYFSKQGAVCQEVLPLFQTGSFRAILPPPKAQNSFIRFLMSTLKCYQVRLETRFYLKQYLTQAFANLQLRRTQ